MVKTHTRFSTLLCTLFLTFQVFTGSFSALVAATKTSTGSGAWNTSTRWTPSGVPTSADSVVIATGHNISLNTNGTCGALNLIGTLTYDATSGRTLTVTTSGGMNGSLRISGTFAMGSVSNQSATIHGNFTNNGTFTAGTGRTTFAGANSAIVSGSSTTNFSTVTVNKGSSSASVLDVQSVITVASNGLTLVNGTFKLSSNSTITPFTVDITTAPFLIPSTAGLWINGGTVTTTDNVTCAGLLRVSSGTFNLGNAIDERFRSTGTIGATVIIEGGAWNIAGRFSRDNIGDRVIFAMSGGTLALNTIGSSDLTHAAFHVDASGSSFTMSGGTIVIQRTGTSNLAYTNLAATTSVAGGTLQIGNASTPTGQTFLVNSSAPIWNLTVNGANSPTAQLSTNALTVKNNLTLTSGSLNANNLGLTVGGNWVNNVSAGAFTPGSATVTFNGTAQQSIGGSYITTFNNLTLNNAAGFSLGTNIGINGTLNMTSGNVLTNSNTVTLGSSTSSRGTLTRTSGTIVGTFKRWFAASTVTNVLFPVGTAANYRPPNISFTGAPSAGGTLTAGFVASNPGSNGLPLSDAGFSIVNHGKTGYWTIASGDGLTGGTYTLDLTADGFEGVQSYTTLRILKRANSSSPWTLNGTHAAGTGSNGTPTVHRTGMSSFSEFGIGGGPDNPLPVQLSSFSARIVSTQTVVLEWSTMTELNNYGFYVERRVEGEEEFREIANSFIPGHGTTLEPQHYSFTDAAAAEGVQFYRLRQVDLDGSAQYSDPIRVDVVTSVTDHQIPTEFALEQNYPNPFNPTTVIRYSTPTNAHVSLKLYNLLGQEVKTLVNERVEAGTRSVMLDASGLSSGVYIYRLHARPAEGGRAAEFTSTKRLVLLR